jgi:1-acyl-sn-glycerol-3-phosphate acyltransferase
MTRWRMLYRLPWLLLLLLIGMPLTLLTFLPPFTRLCVGGRSINEIMQTWWAACICSGFGLRRKVRGSLAPGAQLIAANHVSWLDIHLLHSVAPMGFVAKAEIERWPLAGWLARFGDTVFHHRGSHDSSRGVVDAMNERLGDGRRVAIFAEGGILPGPGVKRFHARLFAAAQESNVPVQPIMLRYLRAGAIDPDMTFRPDEPFMANFFRLLGRPPCVGEVWILPPIAPGGLPRRELAQRTQAVVAAAFAGEPLR